jgi:hypothetical protein
VRPITRTLLESLVEARKSGVRIVALAPAPRAAEADCLEAEAIFARRFLRERIPPAAVGRCRRDDRIARIERDVHTGDAETVILRHHRAGDRRRHRLGGRKPSRRQKKGRT